MNYTLHQLQVFLKVTQMGSITKAAQALHLSQPAVSIQLRNLQEQFDLPLTELQGRRLFVTDFGWEIAQAAERILQEVELINGRMLAYKGLLAGKLRISAVSTGKYVMPYFLSGFLSQHTGVELQMDVTNRQRVLQSLEGNEVDFALVSVLPEGEQWEYLPLMPNLLYLAGPGEQVAPDPTQLPLIYREEGSGTRQTMERFLSPESAAGRRRLELTSNEAVKQAVVAGLGCSVMPMVSMRNELQLGTLRILPAEGLPLRTTWSLLWRSGKGLSPAAQAYLQYLWQEKEGLAQRWFPWMGDFL